MTTFRPAAVLALLSLAACNLLGNSSRENVYALHRRGDEVLPILLSPPAAYPRLLADTLIFADDPGDHAGIVVENRQTFEQSAGQRDHSTTRYPATYQGGMLVMDNCPIGSACIASLVYAPITFAFVSDSLVQQKPVFGNQAPAVYGRVRR